MRAGSRNPTLTEDSHRRTARKSCCKSLSSQSQTTTSKKHQEKQISSRIKHPANEFKWWWKWKSSGMQIPTLASRSYRRQLWKRREANERKEITDNFNTIHWNFLVCSRCLSRFSQFAKTGHWVHALQCSLFILCWTSGAGAYNQSVQGSQTFWSAWNRRNRIPTEQVLWGAIHQTILQLVPWFHNESFWDSNKSFLNKTCKVYLVAMLTWAIAGRFNTLVCIPETTDDLLPGIQTETFCFVVETLVTTRAARCFGLFNLNPVQWDWRLATGTGTQAVNGLLSWRFEIRLSAEEGVFVFFGFEMRTDVLLWVRKLHL